MEAEPERMPGGLWTENSDGPTAEEPQTFPQESNREPNHGWNHEAPEPPPTGQPRRRQYGPRTCRICLEVVQPTFPEGLRETLLGRNSAPTYVSEDAELGRLMSPCKCKGSQKYVHQGCLQAWRESAPLRDRNFFQCPTCQFRYRLDRMSWASHINSAASQLALTLLIVFVAVFILGFVADYIFDLWFDPIGAISDNFNDTGRDFLEDYVEAGGWADHFLKGFYSLGIVGMFKAFWVMSPWNWYNIRATGLLGPRGRRPGAAGRGRMDDITMTVAIIGTLTAIYSLWKGVRFVSRRMLLAASNNVLDVGGDDDDDGEDGEQGEETHAHQD